jgi:hypothetical protein
MERNEKYLQNFGPKLFTERDDMGDESEDKNITLK